MSAPTRLTPAPGLSAIPPGRRLVLLSPHLDDAAFSCGGLLHALARTGAAVEVWTLFTGAAPAAPSPLARGFHRDWGRGGEPMAARALEDRAACLLLGAAPRHLGLPDAVHRRGGAGGGWLYRTHDALTTVPPPGDWALVAQLRDLLRAALPAEATVVAPLALGSHVDHQATRLAAEALGVPLRYYADFPYAGSRAETLRTLELAGWVEEDAGLGAADLAAWCAAAGAHASQVGSFWKDAAELAGAIRSFAAAGGGGLWRPPEGGPLAGEGVSFCVISRGDRPEKLRALAESILAQEIPACEIVVCGKADAGGPWRLVEEAAAAAEGRVSLLRNRAAAAARFGRLVFCDDDVVLDPGWHRAIGPLLADPAPVAGRLLNPDGTRHWDWARWRGGEAGPRLLDYGVEDPCLFLTGGLLAVGAGAWRRTLWNEDLAFGRAEDVDFSRRLANAGWRLRHCPGAVAVHDDPRSTQVGRETLLRTPDGVGRALGGRLATLPPFVLEEIALRKMARGRDADAADCLRALLQRDPGGAHPAGRAALAALAERHGGDFPGNGGWRLLTPGGAGRRPPAGAGNRSPRRPSPRG